MLKLEKIAKTRDLNIILRDQPTFFSKTFLLALAYALLLHLAALLLFHIPSFVIPDANLISPPVYVMSELPDNLMIKDLSLSLSAPEIPAYLIAPQPQMPALLPAAWQPAAINVSGMRQGAYEVHDNPYLAIENELLVPLSEELLAGPAAQSPLSIYVSGPLAASVWHSSISFEAALHTLSKHPSLQNGTPYRFIYDVLVDRSKGTIFWWEVHHADNNKILQELAVTILQQMEFEGDQTQFVASGRIEIVIAPDKSFFSKDAV